VRTARRASAGARSPAVAVPVLGMCAREDGIESLDAALDCIEFRIAGRSEDLGQAFNASVKNRARGVAPLGSRA